MISRQCAACKNSRSKCPPDCIFSPYFPSNNPQRFACVRRIFGAKNLKKMLQALPPELRAQAVESMCFEAQCRIESPVYGCGGIIYQLHQEINCAETQLAKIRAQIALIKPKILQETQVLNVESNIKYYFLQEQNSVNGLHQSGPSIQAPYFF